MYEYCAKLAFTHSHPINQSIIHSLTLKDKPAATTAPTTVRMLTKISDMMFL